MEMPSALRLPRGLPPFRPICLIEELAYFTYTIDQALGPRFLLLMFIAQTAHSQWHGRSPQVDPLVG